MSELTEKQWEPAEINQYLRQLPAIIAKKSQEVIEADTKVRERKHLIAMAEAAVRVRQIGGKDKLNASDVKALAQTENTELYAEMIGLETELALAETRCAYYRDLFDACRKAANLRIEEARRLEGTLSNRRIQ